MDSAIKNAAGRKLTRAKGKAIAKQIHNKDLDVIFIVAGITGF